MVFPGIVATLGHLVLISLLLGKWEALEDMCAAFTLIRWPHYCPCLFSSRSSTSLERALQVPVAGAQPTTSLSSVASHSPSLQE